MELALTALWVLWMGVLTSLYPCPLANNLLVMGYLARNVTTTRRVLVSCGCFVLGMAATLFALGAAIAGAALWAPGVSAFLQTYMHKLLGPLLIVAGMFMLELVPRVRGVGASGETVRRWASSPAGALLLGVLLAVSLCPAPAAMFFGVAVPLFVSHHSPVLLPAMYGLGSALPVAVAAIGMAFAAAAVGRAMGNIARLERWLRILTGIAFVGAGIFYCVLYIYLD